MRIAVYSELNGAGDAAHQVAEQLAAALRTRLGAGGYATVDRPLTTIEQLRGWYAIKVSAGYSEGGAIVLDGIDSPLEAEIARHISRLTHRDVALRRRGGDTFSPASLHVFVDYRDEAAHRDVELGIFRGLDTVLRARRGFRAWLAGVLGALLLVTAAPAHAQTQNIRVVDETGSPLTVGDSASGAIKVKCIGGTCSGGGGASDITTSAAVTGVAGQNIDLAFTQPTATVAVSWDVAWSGTVSWFATVDGTNYKPTLCVDASSGTGHVSAFTATGSQRFYTCPVAGFAGFRVNITVYTSGTPTITIRGTTGHWGDPFASQFLNTINSTLVGGIAVTASQPTGSNLHITCDSGCGSPPATADGSAFTAGSTNVTPIAAVVDDASTTTVAEDAYGAPRMSTNRVLYVDLKQTQANATALKVDGSAVTQPTSNATLNGVAANPGFDASQAIAVQGVTSGQPLAVSGTVAVSNTFLRESIYTGRTPAGASPADNESNTNTALSRIGTFPFVWDSVGGNWDRWTGAVTGSGNFTVVQPTASNLNVSATQGTAAALSLGWPVKVTDGSQMAAVKGISTAAAAADPSLVVAVSPNSPLPTGTNSIGAVTANAGTNLNTSALALSATQTDRTQKTQITDGTRDGTVKAASTLPAATDTALVVTTRDTVTVGGTVTANQGTANATPWNENTAQIGGSTVSTAATGVQKVGVVGNAGAAFDAANNGAAPANVLAIGVEARSSTPTAGTNGNVIRSAGDLAGNQYNVLPISWSCNQQGLAASLTQCQAAPASGYSLYLTSIIATTTTGTAGTFAVRYGTGSNCGTGTTGLWPQPGGTTPSRTVTAPISTAAPMVINLGPVGIKVTAANAICVIGTATNTIDIVLSGYTAP